MLEHLLRHFCETVLHVSSLPKRNHVLGKRLPLAIHQNINPMYLSLFPIHIIHDCLHESLVLENDQLPFSHGSTDTASSILYCALRDPCPHLPNFFAHVLKDLSIRSFLFALLCDMEFFKELVWA